MANANLQITIKAKDESSKVIHEMASPIGDLVKGLGEIGLASIGIESVTGAVKDFMDAALNAQKVQAQLNTVLASTNGISGMTAESVNALASALGAVTPFSDQAIVSVENLLLTFTAIGSDVMPGATEAVLNMATALGEDTKSAAIQLGKALEDPIKGVTSLRRVGVMLTESEKESIKAMMDMGNVAGAQKIILQELTTEFGNSARAAGETFAGRLTILNDQLEKVKEALGGPLLTAATNLLGAILPTISAFAEDLPNAMAETARAISQFIQPAIDIVRQFLTYLDPSNQFDLMRAWFGPDFGPRIDQVTRGIKGIISAFSGLTLDNALSSLGAAFGNLGLAIANLDVQIYAGLFNLILRVDSWIIAQIPGLISTLQSWAGAWIAWIAPMIPTFLAELEKLALGAYGWILAQASILPARLREWGRAFVSWIGPTVGMITTELPKIALGMYGWITAQASILPARLREWGRAFWLWIGPTVTSIASEIPKIALGIYGWIEAQASILPARVREWGRAFRLWIDPTAQELNTNLDQIKTTVLDWISAQAKVIETQLGTWADAFGSWVGPATIAFLKAWPALLNQFLDQIEISGGPIGEKFVNAFIDWVIPAIPKIVNALILINAAIIAFIAESVIVFSLRLAKWGLAFVDWIPTQIPIMLIALDKLGAAIGDWISGQLDALGKAAFALGAHIIDNFISGLKSMVIPDFNSLTGGKAGTIFAPVPASGSSSGGNLGTASTHVTVNVNAANANPDGVRASSALGVHTAARALGLT